jgi:RNA polymerase sigma factor (sigma-70 family)
VRRAIVGPSERVLVWRLKRGDRQACRELIRRHHEGVYGYLRRLGADASLAEDLTQETYARAWSRIETIREAASLRAWLLTIARNQFFQWARVKRPETGPLEELPDRAADDPGAEAAIVIAERDLALRRAVARLEPDLEEAVALHYFQDLSFSEIATVLEVPAGTVKSRIHRALRCLRVLLERGEESDEERRTRKAVAGPA